MITDEVYEHLVFDGRRHLPLASFGDGRAHRHHLQRRQDVQLHRLEDRMGLRPSELIAGVRAAKQYLTYVGGAPFQPAVANALDTEDAWVAALRESLQAKRDRLAAGAHRHRLRRARQLRHLLPVRRPPPAGIRRQHDVLRGSYRSGPGWRPSRCRRSAIRAHRTSAIGTTWCASRSANVTTPWKRRSDVLARCAKGDHGCFCPGMPS